MEKDDARQRVWKAFRYYEEIGKRDGEQEIQGSAFTTLDSLLQACRPHLLGDPVVGTIDGLLTPQTISSGSVRVIDACFTLQQVAAALGPENPPTMPVWSFPPPSPPMNY